MQAQSNAEQAQSNAERAVLTLREEKLTLRKEVLAAAANAAAASLVLPAGAFGGTPSPPRPPLSRLACCGGCLLGLLPYEGG